MFELKRHITAVLAMLSLSFAAAGQTVYVSSSRGNDSASGATPETAVRTIGRAREIGCDIRLRGGDTFYEYLRGSGFALASYNDGENALPSICGFRIIPAEASRTLWERGSWDAAYSWREDSEGDIYRLDLMAEGFTGFTLNLSENDRRNIHNIGAIYDPASDLIHGRKCQCQDSTAFANLSETPTKSPYKYLRDDFDFFQPRGEYRYLYVRASDPELLRGRELWLSSGADAIRGTSFSVSGVRFLGWGKTAVRGGSDITVTGCEFDIIGGSTHEYEHDWVRFGNGVEFWTVDACRDEVARCSFSRIFDTATTIQGPMDVRSRCSGIHFHHNVMRGCRQDFEVWVRSADGSMPQDCSFTCNEGFDSGANGFQTDEYNNTHLLHYILSPHKVTGITVEDNVFHDGMGLYYANSAMDNFSIGHNIYFCAPGAPVIRGLYGELQINAPVREGLRYVYASGLTPDGDIIYSRSFFRRRALKHFNRFINSICGSGFEVKI